MCVAAIAWRADPRWQLVVVGNRDEFHARPTAPLDEWGDGILAGRDLEAGGTWLGVAAMEQMAGRFALVTNYRVEGYPLPQLASRGSLVTNWLRGAALGNVAGMNPFNLFLVGPDGAAHLTNHPEPAELALPTGIHGLSNGDFADRWGKTRRLEAALGEWLAQGDEPDALFAALADRQLDDTVDPSGPAPEFSSVFIANPVYGTRCSTVIAIDHAGNGTISERRFDETGTETGRTALPFAWPALTE